MTARREAAPAPAHGVGTLPVVLVLLALAHLGLLYSHRALWQEQRTSASQGRARLAQEAAQAGVEWALAALNDPLGVNAQCEHTASGAASPGATPNTSPLLRQRWLSSLGTAAPLQPGCVFTGDRWQCECPLVTLATAPVAQLTAPDTPQDHPAFALTLQALDRPGHLQLTSQGCTLPAPDCGQPRAREPDSRYRIEVTLAPLGVVWQPPLATLTSLGPVTLAAGASVVNTDLPSGGVSLQSGSTVSVNPPARLWGPAGQPDDASLIAQDPALHITPQRLWSRLFGLDDSALASLPGWVHLACAGSCNSTALSAVTQQGAPAVWVDGALTLDTAATWGSLDAPVLWVVRGTLRVSAAVQLYGMVIADRIEWLAPGSANTSTSASPSGVQGGLISLGSTLLQGDVQISRHPGVLDLVSRLGGAWVRVPGSWFDPHTR